MMSRELENCIDDVPDALIARESLHEYLTVEDVLLALTGSPVFFRHSCRLRSRP